MRKSVATSVTQFVLAGLAAVVLISAGTIYVVRRNATSEAIRNAREVAGIDGHAVAEPVLADGARMDRVFGTVADRTRSRLTVPVLRTLFGAYQ